MGVLPLNNKAVFLDRDGVINRALVRNRKPYPPDTLQDLEILPDVPEALNLLKESGFLLIVVTNQPDVGRGTQKEETVEEMHLFFKRATSFGRHLCLLAWTGRRVQVPQAVAGDAASGVREIQC